ncbi:MAG: glycosyltransferase family 4 protein [Actinobacteria bacterium]|nr:glycosyltransferase family 4 protein [Actinomycetota bacterium]
MRILLVSANFRPSVGGIERYVELLAEGLAQRGHEVTVLCCKSGGAPRRELANGVQIVRLPATYALKKVVNVHYPIPSPVALASELGRLVPQADVVHVHDALYVTSAAALRRARSRGIPSVLTQHVSFTPQSSVLLDAVQRGVIATIGRCARQGSRVVAYNAAVAAWAESTWGLEKVDILPPGVPEPKTEGVDRTEVRRELGLTADRFLALFVGRDVPTKQLDLFLAATDPAYDLVAVTDRPRASAGPGRHVLPFMQPERLQRLLLAADAFVLPSKAEGFPLSLQEALLAGLPCVITRVPGFDRYLGSGEVLWIDPDPASIRHALLSLVADDDLRASLASRGLNAGRREFGLDAFVDAYERLYLDVRGAAQRPVG